MPNNRQIPVLLLLGLVREIRHWGEFPRQLQENLPDRQILTLDLAGNGLRYQETSPDTVGGMTEDLRSQLAATGVVGEKVHILALSLGGMIAIDWMCRYPSEVSSAVLVNTSVQKYNPFYQRLYWRSYYRIMSLPFLSPGERERVILQLTSNHRQQDQDLMKHWRSWQQQCPVSSGNAKRQLLAALNFSVTTKPRQPLLFATSRGDHLVHPGCSRAIARAWKAVCIEHPDAGHDLPLDDPQWMLQQMHAWLQGK